jgi:N-acetylmuramoyl-L-alanine amidase
MSLSISVCETSIRTDLPAPYARPLRSAFILSCVLSLCFLPVPAAGAPREIPVTREGVTTPLKLPEYKSQGVSYASMKDLARQLGGALDVSSARATFRYKGMDAEAGLNDTEVYGGTSALQLTHPILAYEGDALIAMVDVVPFLRGAFAFGTPDNLPETSALSVPTAAPPVSGASDLEDAMEADTLEAVVAPDPENPPESASGFESVAISPAGEPAKLEGARADGPALGRNTAFMLAIDPGHGGEDTGILGAEGLSEKDLCLSIASNLRRLLKEQYGIATVMTRVKDETVSLSARRSRAADAGATLMLSIHGGVSSAPAVRGYEVFAHRPKRSLSVSPKPALGAAQVLAKSLNNATSQRPRAVREIPLGLVREGNLPCVLVEFGNIANPEDEAKLASKGHQSLLVSALARGIGEAVGQTGAAGSSL